MRRPHTPCDIAPRTFRRRRLHGAGAGPVVARGWGWGWSTEGAEGGGPAPRDAGRRPHRCPDPRDAEPQRRHDSDRGLGSVRPRRDRLVVSGTWTDTRGRGGDRGHTRKLAPPSRGSLQTPGCSQRCGRPRDEQRTPPRTAPLAGGCAPGVRLYPTVGGDAWAAVRSGVPPLFHARSRHCPRTVKSGSQVRRRTEPKPAGEQKPVRSPTSSDCVLPLRRRRACPACPRPPLEAQSPGGAGRARGQCCSSSPHPAQPGPKGARSTPAKPDRRKPLCTPRAKDTLLLSPWRSRREPLLPRQRSGRDFESEPRAQQFPAQRHK